ncbi:hypothetical protein [Bacillus sp. EB01]|uniref:hypothetical protein n=1 Tax=Bacillus sp. EB01 TaxID=1347086 RepID=UPI0005C4EEE3|nr:hypothetical protein [Bacillus sp. EB01]
MNKRGWSDKEVAELIRNMPKVTDDRDPRDIFQNISMKIKKKRKGLWIMPGIAAAAAAVLLFLLISPGAFNLSGDGNKTSTAGDKSSQTNLVATDDSKKKNQADDTQMIALVDENPGHTGSALYAEEVGESEQAVTIFVPDGQIQNLVPVTVKVPEEGGSWVDSLKTAMQSLKEEEWGLSEYYPMDVALEGNDTFVVDVPDEHNYLGGSPESLFVNSINENVAANAADSVTKIKYKTNGKPGIYLSNYGEKKSDSVEVKRNRAYLFAHQEGKDVPYMVPTSEEFKNFEAAIEAMKTDDFQTGLQPSLPPTFKVKEITSKDKILYLSLAGDSDLKNDPATLHSFEALLLTAKDFGFTKVKINNAPIENLGPFLLNQEINVPLGANKMKIE